MMRGFLIGILVCFLHLLLTGCADSSGDLENPVRTFGKAAVEGDRPTVEFNPKVDVLFVIDDSASMKPHQERLVQNIDKFVNAFAQFDIIDFHIGAVTVWDSGRYRTKQNPNGAVPPVSQDGFVNFLPNGQLQGGFVSRTTGFAEKLKTKLNISPKCHESYADCNTPIDPLTGEKEGRGPEDEELFSPVDEALTNRNLIRGPNKGFRRNDAHLVVIFISDADDSTSNITVSQMQRTLEEVSNSTAMEQNYSVYGVIHSSDVADSSACPKDPIRKSDRIENLIQLANGEKLNICSKDYGTLLAQIGEKIRRKTLSKTIYLPYRPEYQETKKGVEWITVRYGKSQIIPNDAEKGWTYDVRNNAVIIHEGVEIKAEKGAKLVIEYIPVHMRNRKGNRFEKLN